MFRLCNDSATRPIAALVREARLPSLCSVSMQKPKWDDNLRLIFIENVSDSILWVCFFFLSSCSVVVRPAVHFICAIFLIIQPGRVCVCFGYGKLNPDPNDAFIYSFSSLFSVFVCLLFSVLDSRNILSARCIVAACSFV